MSFFNGLKKSFTDPTLWRILKIQFHKSTMSQTQKQAYDELVKQVDLRVTLKNCEQQEIVVPASMTRHDAQKALKLIKLEFDPSWDFHITWEAEAGKRTTLSEKKTPPATPPAPAAPPPVPDAPKS